MTTKSDERADEFQGLDAPLAAELPTFELFFKTFGFKRVHGRVWGLLVLAGRALTMREITNELGLSQGATSTTLHELEQWGAIQSEFDPERRCHVHSAVGNTLSIVATVFRRREQVVFQRFKQSSQATLEYVRTRYGEKDARVLTLRSIISSCEIGEAMMQLLFSSVERALGDNSSLLHRAVNTALKVGMKVPTRILAGKQDPARMKSELAASILSKLPEEEDEADEDEEEIQAPLRAPRNAPGRRAAAPGRAKSHG